MLTFIHTDINISSTTKSGATIGMGKFTGIYKSFIQDHQLLAGKVAVEPIDDFFTSHAFATAVAVHNSHRHSILCLILVHDLVHGRLFVPGSRHDVFVISGDVAAENARRLVRLEDGGAIGRSPGVEQVVFAGGDEPLATVGKLEGEDAALMEVELVLVWFVAVEHFHV